MGTDEEHKHDQDYNIELAHRQVEINEWSYNNKMDTLFFFQILFITLMFLAILFYLKGAGFLSGAFVWYVFAVVILLLGLILINRAMYSRYRRDQRFWHRRRFDEDNKKDSPLSRGDASFQEYIDAIRAAFGDGGRTCKPCSN